MEYGPVDSSGTDDDLLPSYHNRGARGGRIAGNGRSSTGIPYNIMQTDMETHIHQLEKDAYYSVLRAFQAQADAITWEKEGLITELRKELRVSDDEHRELLGRINADDLIQRIRQWRETGGGHSGFPHNVLAVHEPIYGPSTVASRKRQKISRTTGPLMFDSPMQPCSAAGDILLASKTREISGTTSRIFSRYPSTAQPGANQTSAQIFPNTLTPESAKSVPPDPLIGRKVFIKCHADNNFYEALISSHDPAEGLHALVYDRGTVKETVEWVNLKEIPRDDIRWEGHPGFPCGPGLMLPFGRGRAVSGNAGRGRGTMKIQAKKDHPHPQQSLISEMEHDQQIMIPATENLIREVERMLESSNPDPFEMEKVKKYLKDHERCLLDALTKLGEPLGENEGNHQVRGEHHQPGSKEVLEALAIPCAPV